MTEHANEGCIQCGHPDGAHQLVGAVDERLGVPTSGWRECPDCDCYMTWSVGPDLLAALEARAAQQSDRSSSEQFDREWAKMMATWGPDDCP